MCFIFSRFIMVCHLASSTSCRFFTDADRQTSRGRVVYALLIIASDQFTHGNRVQHVSSVRGVCIKVSNIRTSNRRLCKVIAALSTTSPLPLIRNTILLSIAPNGLRDDVITCRWFSGCVVFRNSKGAKAQQLFIVFGILLILLQYIVHNNPLFRDKGMALAAPGAYVSPRRLAGLPAQVPVKVVGTLPAIDTTATIVMRRHQRIIADTVNFE